MGVKVRNVLQQERIVPHRDMVEQHQVLVNLPHIAYVRHTGKRNFFAIRLTARNSLTPANRVQSA